VSVIEQIFAVSPAVRYVALYRNGELTSRQRAGAEGASSSESDRYEELLVNPVLLTLVRQGGNIDCGGAEFVIVRYGNFYQLITCQADMFRSASSLVRTRSTMRTQSGRSAKQADQRGRRDSAGSGSRCPETEFPAIGASVRNGIAESAVIAATARNAAANALGPIAWPER
jgi:hypothetical protein